MSVLERCPSYRESNKRSKERQGPTLSVRLIEVSVKRESTVLTMLYQMAETTEFVDEIRTCDHCEKIFSTFLLVMGCVTA